jgi:hypothetical protein
MVLPVGEKAQADREYKSASGAKRSPTPNPAL